MKTTLFKMIRSIVLALCFVGLAQSATWYVSQSSPQNGPGTSWDNAFHTIQGGVDAAADGDTVLVNDGTYNLSSQITIVNDITLQSRNGAEATTIDGMGSVRCIGVDERCYLVYINGFTIQNGQTSGDGGGVYYDGMGDLFINDCRVLNNTAGGSGGGIYGAGGKVDRCLIKGNAAATGGGLAVGLPHNCLIINNSASVGGALLNATAYNCTIVKNTASQYHGAGGAYINCIVWDNEPVDYNPLTKPVGYSSCAPNLTHGSDGNITNAPNFVNIDLDDYRLLPSSPCINLGNNAQVTTAYDYAGDTRVQSSTVDMGAYEFDSTIVYYTVTFDLGAKGTHNGSGGSLSQQIEQGRDATAPTVIAHNEWVFEGWDIAFSSVQSNITVMAQYSKKAGQIFNWYVSVYSKQDGPGTNWATAFQTIQGGVDAAADGDTVLVGDGTYDTGTRITPAASCQSMNRIVITNDITVVSLNGPEVTFIFGEEATDANGGPGINAVRGVYMSTGILAGFTITNGYTQSYSSNYLYDECGGGVNCYEGDGIVSNCVLTGNSADRHGGGSYYGTLVDCTLVGNSAWTGGGSYYGRLDNCALSDNSASTQGGGSHYSTLNNCALTSNSAEDKGGGSSYGTLNNCVLSSNSVEGEGGGSYYGILTNCVLVGNAAGIDGGGSCWGTLINCVLVDNSAGNFGGGSYYGSLRHCNIIGNSANEGGGAYRGSQSHCIIYYNTAYLKLDNRSGSSTAYCCTPNGHVASEPKLISASHIRLDSSCFQRGAPSSTGTDLDGDAWRSPSSIGCDEPELFAQGEISIFQSKSNLTVAKNHAVRVPSYIIGHIASNCWNFGDGTFLTNNTPLGAVHAWESPGVYEVTLTAWNNDYPEGVSSTTTVEVLEASFYVNSSNTTPVAPYTNWATAAKSIQPAVDEASAMKFPGSTVWVADGIYDSYSRETPGYSSLNRVVITNDITVRSVSGPEKTFIVGKGPIGPSAERGVYMSDGLLSGFTITNGHTKASGDYQYERCGGGVKIYGSKAVVSNCVLTGNSADAAGGGSHGSGSGYGSIPNGTLNNCTLSHNLTDGDGGGSSGNTLNNCTLSSNFAADDGGGSDYSTLNNCVLFDNSANSAGGGTFYTKLVNCTLTGNSAKYGGGSFEGSLNNCIIYYNTANSRGDNWDQSELSYSCTTPVPEGAENIFDAPLFIDAENGNYRLQASSPCINKGNNDYISFQTDFENNSRIVGGRVDIGAFETKLAIPYLHLSIGEKVISTPMKSITNFSFSVVNIGIKTINYEVASDTSWLTTIPSSGSTTGEVGLISAYINSASLVVGSYTGELTVVATEAINTTQSIVVVVDVFDPDPWTETESFEEELRLWGDVAGLDFTWTREDGATSSSSTGPSGASDGSWYLYTEASDHNNETAAIETTFDFAQTLRPKLEFDYHMYGANMGSLFVDIYDGSWNSNVWSRSGQQHSSSSDDWTRATVDLSTFSGNSNVVIRFRALTGNGYKSDMAIDNIIVSGTRIVTDGDTDNDDLPDWWEEMYFGGSTNALADALCANKARKVREAYVAGFDPTDPNADFEAEALNASTNGYVVTWQSVSGRVYNVFWKQSLTNDPQLVSPDLAYPVNSYTDTLHQAESAGFYLIDVQVEPAE